MQLVPFFTGARTILFPLLMVHEKRKHKYPLSLLKTALGEGLLLASHSETPKVEVRFYCTISTIFQLHYGLNKLQRSSEIQWKEHELWSQTDLGTNPGSNIY